MSVVSRCRPEGHQITSNGSTTSQDGARDSRVPLEICAHLPDLLDGEISICRDTSLPSPSTCPHVHNHHHRSLAEPFEEVADLEVGRAQAGASVIEPDRPFLGYMMIKSVTAFALTSTDGIWLGRCQRERGAPLTFRNIRHISST
jgi:hypothetical protein